MSEIQEIDEKTDYYAVLGVPPTATIDELKVAYLILAKKYHPDTSLVERPNEAEFIKITKAWKVLSKPETKLLYDSLRRKFLGIEQNASLFHNQPNQQTHEMGDSLRSHQQNFRVVQNEATSNWRDIQDKYKTEKWQKLTLDEKKVRRAKVVTGGTPMLVKYFAPVVAVGAFVYFAVKN